MNRRKFGTLLASSGLLAVGGGAVWLNLPRDHTHLSIEQALAKLEQMRGTDATLGGNWGSVRTLHHLAQSIEFSMDGYPEHKSAAFQKTVGRLAFKVFNARGEMAHGIEEAIPGEVIVEAGDREEAFDRVAGALVTFRDFGAELKPHFAYGALTKDEYAFAHVMHINDHLG